MGVKTSISSPHEDSNSRYPEWIRLPKNGERCALTSIPRSTMFKLVTTPASAPRVISKVIKTNPKASRGIRLVNVKSLLDFIANSDSKES
jgi:hypothetical protein